MDQTTLQNMRIELRRGTQTLAVMSQLKKMQYGYSLLQNLEKTKTPIEAGTLYPLMRRLESQGLLKSEWDTTESRPRKYYSLSDDGEEAFELLKKEWEAISEEMAELLKEEKQ